MTEITAAWLRDVEDREKRPHIFHEQKDLISYLKDIDGVLYTELPVFVIDWECMRFRDSFWCNIPGISIGYAQTGYSFDNIESTREFVKKNKHQIVIYKFALPCWVEEVGIPKNVPSPVLFYAIKPDPTPNYDI
jgi:hypothetical protein